VTQPGGLGAQLDRQLVAGPVRVEGEGCTAEVDVEDVDRLGVRVRGLRVTGSAPGDITKQAERLPDACRALPERIVPVEIAPGLGGAVLRTDPREVVEREFFEVRTDGRAVTVGRVQSGPEGREARPFTVTREQLKRLVDGLGEAMEPRAEDRIAARR
jgi:hypothetical protein